MGRRNLANFGLCFLILGCLLVLVPLARAVFLACAAFYALVWLSWDLKTVTRRFFLYKTVDPAGKAVFVTGCDSGFGHSLVKRLDKLGYLVFAGCLDESSEGARNLTDTCSSRLRVLQLDVTKDDSVQAAKDFIVENLGDNVLWTVVNNAGIATGGELEWTPMEDLQRLYEVNCNGTLRVTKTFLSLIRKSRGRLVNTTSACGEFICPGFVGYCMSKSAAIALTVGLRVEMKKWNVRVISIQPFFYKTPLTQVQNCVQLVEKLWSRVDPEVREDYGEAYKERFVQSTREVLDRGSPRIQDVVGCLEDAVTAADPLDTYSPAFLLDKLGIKFLKLWPASVGENYQRLHLEGTVKPAAKMKNRSKLKLN